MAKLNDPILADISVVQDNSPRDVITVNMSEVNIVTDNNITNNIAQPPDSLKLQSSNKNGKCTHLVSSNLTRCNFNRVKLYDNF